MPLARILEKIIEVNRLRKTKGLQPYLLRPVVSERQVHEFEEQHEIRLPEEYRIFLLQAGDGNKEPFHKGIAPLDDSDKFHHRDEQLIDLKTLFPFNEKMAKDILWEKTYRWYPAEHVRNILKDANIHRLAGCLLLNYEGWGSSYTGLVVNGDQQGKIWHVDDLYHPYYSRSGNAFTTYSFLEWVEHQLDLELAPSPFELIKAGKYESVKHLDLSGEAQLWQHEFTIEDAFQCTQLESLDLSRNYNLTHLPRSIENLENLIELKFNGGSLLKLPKEIICLKKMEILEFSFQERLEGLPSEIGNLNQLRRLTLYWNSSLKRLPTSVADLKNLVYLSFNQCKNLQGADLKIVGQLPQVSHLVLTLAEIPNEIEELQHIKHLKIEKAFEAKKKFTLNKIKCLRNLKRLDLSNCGLTKLPRSITQLTNLEHLDLTGNPLTALPDNVGDLSNLSTIILEKTNIKCFPRSLGSLHQLARLEIRDCQQLQLSSVFSTLGKLQGVKEFDVTLKSRIPKGIGRMRHLEALRINSKYRRCQLIPKEIGMLQRLTLLKVESTGELVLPPQLIQLNNLKVLSVFAGRLELPENFGALEELRELDVSDCGLTRLPESFSKLARLERLNLRGNVDLDLTDGLMKIARLPKLQYLSLSTRDLPATIGQCTQIRELEIHNRADYENYDQPLILPNELGCLSQLTRLNLEENQIREVPESIGSLRKLVYLNLDQNKIQHLPNFICDLNNLRELVLRKNQLDSLPDSISKLKKLTHLDISDNRLTALPTGIAKLSQLRELIVDDNRINEIPQNIAELPYLEISLRWHDT